MNLFHRLALVASLPLALAACGGGHSPDAANTDAPLSDASGTDVVRTDAPPTDGAGGDTQPDVVVGDTPVTDVIVADTGNDDVQSDITATDTPAIDTGNDDTMGTDVTSTDTVAVDVIATDASDVASTDTGAVDAPVDVPTDVVIDPDPCAATRLQSLNTIGTLSGQTLSYTGSNANTPQPPVVMAPCGRPGHVVAFSYTTRNAGRLLISTYHAGTAANFDTVVWAQTTCVATGATSLGCDDDVPFNDQGRNPPPPDTSGRDSIFSTVNPGASPDLPAGTTIFIFVAGYSPPTGTPWIDNGTFQLTVTEIAAPSPAGGACDPNGTMPAGLCAAGLACGATGADYSSFSCVTPGQMGTPCRAATPQCDPNLVCDGTNTCVTPTPIGGTCNAGSTCVMGAHCIMGATTSTCVADGTMGGQCINFATCNSGLSCGANFTCVPTVMAGGACDTTRTMNVCATGSHCIMGATTATCVTDGTMGGQCLAGAMCNAGLGCNVSNRCVPSVMAGGACDATRMMNVCATGSHCIMGATTATCVTDGTMGGQCLAGAMCNAGLGCNVSNRCVPSVMAGGACDTTRMMNVCVAGSHCIMGATTATCVTDGTMGGQCLAGATCNAGLGCNSSNVCMMALANGATCDPARVMNVCASGSHCIMGATMATCIVDGTMGGQCLAGAMCNAGLGCNGSNRCVTATADGAACDPSGATTVCLTGSHCIAGMGPTVCKRDGSTGGQCRTTAPSCDAGNACNGTPTDPNSRCIMGLANGAACMPNGTGGRCASGSVCTTVGAMSTCQVHGYSTAASAATWIDACAATGSIPLLMGQDDATANVTLPFPLTFYGNTYAMGATTEVSSNGFYTFTPTGASRFNNATLPDPTLTNAIFALWDDLIFQTGTPTPQVCVATTGTTPSRNFVVEWFMDSFFRNNADFVTMEIQFHEGSGAFDVLYNPLMGTSAFGHATVGVESPLGTSFTQVCGGATPPAACTATTIVNTRYTPVP